MLTELFFVLSLAITPLVQPWWNYLCTCLSPYTMFVTGCLLSQILGYFLGCLPFILLDHLRPRATCAYKIQRRAYPTARQLAVATRDVLLSSFLSVVLPMLVLGGYFLPLVGIVRDGPLPPWYVILVQILFFFVVEDYLNYWLHRWLHTPWLYNNIHAVHHMYDAPFSLTAANAHPAETVILAIPTFMGPLAIAPHLYTLMLWQLFRTFEAIDIHSGYELPYSLKSIFPPYAGASHHDYHHYMHSGNFASVFTWCDYLYGTDLGYRNYCSKRKPL